MTPDDLRALADRMKVYHASTVYGQTEAALTAAADEIGRLNRVLDNEALLQHARLARVKRMLDSEGVPPDDDHHQDARVLALRLIWQARVKELEADNERLHRRVADLTSLYAPTEEYADIAERYEIQRRMAIADAERAEKWIQRHDTLATRLRRLEDAVRAFIGWDNIAQGDYEPQSPYGIYVARQVLGVKQALADTLNRTEEKP